MKKIFHVIIIGVVTCAIMTGCQQNNAAKNPDISQIRNICDLATLECYYHNVAKSTKLAGGWFQENRKFWIDYSGTAKIGVDMSKVNMEFDGENVNIFMPNATLLGISIDEATLTEDSYIISGDGWVGNPITVDDQTAAISVAQEEMRKNVESNTSLLINAQTRAQELIENYINNLGNIAGVKYNIKWVYEQTNVETPQ